MPKKAADMSTAEREKMLVRLAEMRDKVAENRRAKAEAQAANASAAVPVTESKPNTEVFTAPKVAIKPAVPKKNDELMLERLDKVASHLEELAFYKKEKINAKKQKEQETKIIQDVKTTAAVTPAAPVIQEFQFPRSHGNRFFQSGRF
jgi:hypothetical protein